LILIGLWHRMNHSVKRRHQALHQTHHHYYLNISVEAAKLSGWRIESNRIETFLPELECSSVQEAVIWRRRAASAAVAMVATTTVMRCVGHQSTLGNIQSFADRPTELRIATHCSQQVTI